MAIYTITPSDILFFRDARPFEAGGGHGGRWPYPNIIFAALHAALHRAFPDGMPDEHRHCHKASNAGANKYDPTRRDKRFGSLRSAGPFPVKDNTWFFPAPADVTSVAENLPPYMPIPLTDKNGKSNLPKPLQYPLGNTATPAKNKPVPWWSKAAMEAYLQAKPLPTLPLKNEDFFDSEWTTGIGIDPETQTQDQEHIYSAEYLRLKPNVSMGVIAEMPLKNGSGDGLDQLFIADGRIVVGGQQRICSVDKISAAGLETVLPLAPAIPQNCQRIKWVLLSPAVFPAVGENGGGWLPTWIDPATGAVKLRVGPGKNKAKRQNGKEEAEAKELNVKLVAACVPKPMVINGWSECLHLYAGGLDETGKRKHGPTATVLAVPAGSVYYFEGQDAPLLAAKLNWHAEKNSEIPEICNRRSSIYGEQGFGMGICGTW